MGLDDHYVNKKTAEYIKGGTNTVHIYCATITLFVARFLLGVYTGYSAMSIAMVLPPGGVVVGCDTTEEYANMGKPLWKEVIYFGPHY